MCVGFLSYAQTATFITLNSGGSFSRVTISAAGCNTTSLNLCSNFTGAALSIALDSNILYVVDNKGFLYKNILTSNGTSNTCTQLGQFANNTTGYFGLTVGNGGIVYTAFGGSIESYNPATNIFSTIGTLPNGWVIGGDLLFYQGNLFEAVNTTNGTNALIQVDLANIANSSLYMSFNAGSNVFGFASVTVACSSNQAYALSTAGSTTSIYAVDMLNKTQATATTCTLSFKVNDAASIAETQTANNSKIISTNLDSCNRVAYLGKVYTASTVVIDTLKNASNCDSIYYVTNIKITSPATTVAVPLFGCKNVVYNNKPYSASISFIDTLKSKQGCDSIYNNVAITIAANALNIPINLSDCKPIVYNNKPYKTSTIFIDTLRGKQGCDSIYNNVNITITPLVTTQNTINLAACGMVNYSNNSYYLSTQINDTFKTITGCDSAYKTVNIKVYPMPTIVAGGSVYVLLNNFVTLHPTITNATKIEWTPTNYLNNYNSDSVVCTPLKDIVYKIKATSQDGCTDSAYQNIFVDKALKIPTAFSPNGDNVNDTWLIDGLRFYPQNTVQVFSRYGQNVYSTFAGNYKPWNGRLNGNELPIGVYYYIIKLSPLLSPITGSISIFR